jgi:FG-GAP-like repeat
MQKIIYTSLSLLFSLFSQAQFAAVSYIDSLQGESVSQLKSADFNNDGLPDMIVSATRFPVDSLRLYLALGNGQYSRQTIAAIQNTGDIDCFDIADINNDGWVDIALITHNATRLAWYENNGGVFTHHPLAANLDFTTQLLIKDFDCNGLQDILALQHVEIVLYLQSSPGVFEAGTIAHSGTEFYAIDAGYYNNDSLPDISVASGGFEVLLNTGNGHFSLHSQAGLSLCFGLQSADLDNDSDIDIGMYESLRGILFYRNDGNGHFSFADTILRSSDIFDSFGFADFDCDNDKDVYTTIRQQGRVVWVENKLAGRFSQPKNQAS